MLLLRLHLTVPLSTYQYLLITLTITIYLLVKNGTTADGGANEEGCISLNIYIWIKPYLRIVGVMLRYFPMAIYHQ